MGSMLANRQRYQEHSFMHYERSFLAALFLSQFWLAYSSEGSTGTLPQPYTPIKASGSEFRCLGRVTKLGPLLLPEQIVAAGQPLLAGPVRLAYESKQLMQGKGKLVEKSDDKASWQWTGGAGFPISVRMTGECDGFCWYEISLTPEPPVTLSSLRLEIPLQAGRAKYLHTASFTWGNFSGGLAEAGGKWSGPFMPYIWLGDEERGLAWCAESDRGWMLKDPAKAIRIETKGSVVLFTVQLLDHEEVISRPLTIRFGLQASPVKPVSFAWRAKARILHNVTYEACQPDPNGLMPLDTLREGGVKTVVFHDGWTDYYGKVATPYGDRLRKLISECHKRDIKLLVYVGYGLARQAPELQGHHDEWSAIPLIPWTTSYRPDFRNFDAACPRSGWADWLVKGIDRLFADYELDGLYFDGTSEAWQCQNQAHGCGWKDDAGKLHSEYPILAARDLMRRLADAVHRHRPDAILDVHMSSNLTLPTLSFCDSYWNGEQFESYTSKDKFELPLHAFRTEFMGYAHGLNAEFLCYDKRPFTMQEAIALAWVHGVEVRPYTETLVQVTSLWRAMDRFGTSSAEWLPYWSGSGCEAEDASVKVSAWATRGKALLIVSHLKRAPLKTNVHLDRKRLGLASGPLSAVDAMTGDNMEIKESVLPLDFDGMSCRFIEVRDKHFRQR
ncbi:MAG: hypothetical protein C5B50_14105 [Verrucomicrobia bacterium]|nr:MAG: hypothetical protein C5B50_14105 [Verrucomicrobiota bacterium]